MGRFEHSPIKRHEALAPFSRDHYVGLVQAQHMIKAADGDEVARRKAVAEFIDTWNREIVSHFAKEEKFLIPLMEQTDCRILLDAHRQLNNLARKVREQRKQMDPDPLIVRQAGQLLEQHIRWEERELFVRLQNQLGEKQLSDLQIQMTQA